MHSGSQLPKHSVQLAICRNEVYDQDHCGILYFDGDHNRILHLAWHKNVRNDNSIDGYIFKETPLSVEEQKAIAAFCGLIAENKPGIPYGFDHSAITIDPLTGVVTCKDPDGGLTCVTFVLLIFRTYGLSILRQEEWPDALEEDVAWQKRIVERLKAFVGKPRSPEKHVGSKRFTPRQVVGAGSEANWPVGYNRANELAAVLLQDLQRFAAAQASARS